MQIGRKNIALEKSQEGNNNDGDKKFFLKRRESSYNILRTPAVLVLGPGLLNVLFTRM